MNTRYLADSVRDHNEIDRLRALLAQAEAREAAMHAKMADFDYVWGRPTDDLMEWQDKAKRCDQAEAALSTARAEAAQWLEMSERHCRRQEAAEAEADAMREKVRVCSGALTPVSENEKRGMERVLAILDRKIAEGGAVTSNDAAAVERHNAHFRARWSAFQECAMMLRAALQAHRPHGEEK